MTDPDRSRPAPLGGEPRGVGEARDAPGADVPAVEDAPSEQPMERADSDLSTVRSAAGPAAPAVVIVVPAEISPGAPQQVRLRRAPRYRAFIGTGAILGALLALLLTGAFPATGRFSTGAVMGYLVVSLALLGALLGAGVAVLVERPRRR